MAILDMPFYVVNCSSRRELRLYDPALSAM
jgi:hypothetical protein